MTDHQTTTPLTAEETQVLRHSLTGSNAVPPYRNYFAAGDGHGDMPHLRALIARGYMRKGKSYNKAGDCYFHVTAAGAAAVGLRLP